MFLALVKITPVDVYMHIYCYVHECKSECVFTCMGDNIYSDSASLWNVYMMPIGYANYVMLGVLIANTS